MVLKADHVPDVRRAVTIRQALSEVCTFMYNYGAAEQAQSERPPPENLLSDNRDRVQVLLDKFLDTGN